MKKKQQVFNNIDEDFRAIGINALLIQELSVKRGTDHALDLLRMTSFDSDTGLDLQVCFAKLNNLLKDPANREIVAEGNTSYLEQEDQVNILRLLVQYSNFTHAAYQTLDPSIISAYLFSISEQLSLCFEADADHEKVGIIEEQMSLYLAARIVLKNRMSLLGVITNTT